MSMKEWAEREIRLACEREAASDPDYKEGEWQYGIACYESALKAFTSLCEDGHSGFSMSITKQILCRLIDHKPLSPIVDTDDVWVFVEDRGFYKSYKCNRMSSLYKDVYKDGIVKYTDVRRVCGINITENGDEIRFSNGFITKFIDEMFPITMPYMPLDDAYKVYCEDYLLNNNNGDYDTICMSQVKTPTGEIINIDKIFTHNVNSYDFVEISKEEFTEMMNKKRQKENEK